MNKKLDDILAQAFANPSKSFDLRDIVICDSCNADYTTSTASGGFIFGSYGYCPACAPRMLTDIRRYNEEAYIKARCPAGVSFADFVRNYRGPEGNTVIVYTSKD